MMKGPNGGITNVIVGIWDCNRTLLSRNEAINIACLMSYISIIGQALLTIADQFINGTLGVIKTHKSTHPIITRPDNNLGMVCAEIKLVWADRKANG